MAQTPGKKMMRGVTEYIRSPQQVAASKLGLEQTKPQLAAKNHFRKQEAQGLVDIFRQRIENALEETFDEFTVTEYQGDFVRKAFAKVRISDENVQNFVHIYAVRVARGENWTCRLAPWKEEDDPLEQNEDEYEDLPERSRCSQKFGDLDGCAVEVCALM
mmetsp:Transcript_10510/g.22180  ORF Transcript_10510/g.22180 Transcript_10510/m.22180 type:complete len:160 (+) Transcript_10510:125-604(+)